jgi:hypothetical protein
MKQKTRWHIQHLLRLVTWRMPGNPSGMLLSDLPRHLRGYVHAAKDAGVVQQHGMRLRCDPGQGFASPEDSPRPSHAARPAKRSSSDFLLLRAAFCVWARERPHAAYIRRRAHEVPVNDVEALRALVGKVSAYYGVPFHEA